MQTQSQTQTQTQTQTNSISISNIKIDVDELFTHIIHLDLNKQKQLLSALYDPKLEPNLIQYIEYIFGISSDFKQLPQLIELTDIVVSHCNPYCWEKISHLVNSGLRSVKFSTKLLALNIIGQFASRYPEATAQNMPEIMSMLISVSSDPKPQVKTQVASTFVDVANTIENVDVKHLFPVVISAYTAPADNTQKALDALIATPFVNDIDIPTMGFLVPLLTRSMKERKMVYQRRAAVVIQTLCKLLKNPVYAKPFYGVLEPVLTRGFEEIADPEIRQVCSNSLEVLNKVHAQGTNKILESYTHTQCVDQYKQILSAYGVNDSSELVIHSADLVLSLIHI
jgi:hypothetical protein